MRIKGGITRRRRRKEILRKAKGFRGAAKNRVKVAKEAVMKAERYAYVGRRQKKRDIRRLWIQRINIALRNADPDLSYSKFINGLKKANIDLNRKMLADMAVYDKEGFLKVIEAVKNNQQV